MKPIFSLILPLFFALACTKGEVELPQNCTRVTVYSDKYTGDTTYLKTDILYQSCLFGAELQKCINAGNSWAVMCDISLPFRLERIRYEIGSKKTQPYIKK